MNRKQKEKKGQKNRGIEEGHGIKGGRGRKRKGQRRQLSMG